MNTPHPCPSLGLYNKITNPLTKPYIALALPYLITHLLIQFPLSPCAIEAPIYYPYEPRINLILLPLLIRCLPTWLPSLNRTERLLIDHWLMPTALDLPPWLLEPLHRAVPSRMNLPPSRFPQYAITPSNPNLSAIASAHSSFTLSWSAPDGSCHRISTNATSAIFHTLNSASSSYTPCSPLSRSIPGISHEDTEGPSSPHLNPYSFREFIPASPKSSALLPSADQNSARP